MFFNKDTLNEDTLFKSWVSACICGNITKFKLLLPFAHNPNKIIADDGRTLLFEVCYRKELTAMVNILAVMIEYI